MIRGTITFKCDQCGHKFKGPDIEYLATTLSMPLECPQCGSFHTYPSRSLLAFVNRPVYKRIWKDLDKQNGKEKED